MSNTDKRIDVSQRVLDTLAETRVTPKPRWYFAVQEVVVWSLGAGATLCGSIAVSATLFVLVTAPARTYLATHENALDFWLDFAPLFWIGMFVAFIVAADFFLRKTRRGYRYSLLILTVASATLSLILGYVGFVIGLGEFLERRVGPSIPFHTPVYVTSQKFLYQPEKGIITGTVTDDDSIVIRSQNGMLWDLDLEYLPETQRGSFSPGTVVSVIGTSTSDKLFIVCMVLPASDELPGTDENERKDSPERNTICKGVRPYQRLQAKLLH